MRPSDPNEQLINSLCMLSHTNALWDCTESVPSSSDYQYSTRYNPSIHTPNVPPLHLQSEVLSQWSWAHVEPCAAQTVTQQKALSPSKTPYVTHLDTSTGEPVPSPAATSESIWRHGQQYWTFILNCCAVFFHYFCLFFVFFSLKSSR